MSLDLLKKLGETLGKGFEKALEAFAVLAIAALVIVIAYYGVDVAVYVFEAGIGALETILALIP